MSLKSFTVKEQKGLRLAQCAAVPPLMIICGPNGSGKSTLLSSLRQNTAEREVVGETDFLYQPPHRGIRRQSVERRWLASQGQVERFSALLGIDAVPTLEGLSIPYPSRTQDNVDESGSAIKYVLGRLENRRQSYITSRVDGARLAGQNTLDIASVENIFAPLDELVHRLLPHLTFKGVDFSNDQVRCVFVRTAEDGSNIELDLDDLSSGEKSVVLLFLPLIEAEIHEKLDRVSGAEHEAAESKDRVFLLDEPELHIHPDLQRRMLAFMRERSSVGQDQFVLVTHSTTILDEAGDDELYILRLPASPTTNQLRRVASAGERLEALRELTGESYFVATGRNIVLLEGEPKREGREGTTDVSIVEALHARANRYTFIAMGGRNQVADGVTRLRSGLPPEEYGVAVTGLVDGDRTEVVSPGVISWPVCEFENLLLSPAAIEAALKKLQPDVTHSSEEIQHHLDQIADERREEEVRLRVGAALPLTVFRLSGTSAEQIQELYEEQKAKLEPALTTAALEKTIDNARREVDEILKTGTHLSRFKGKALLRALYQRLSLQQVSYEQFCYALAQECKSTTEVRDQVEEVFAALDGEVNSELKKTLLA